MGSPIRWAMQRMMPLYGGVTKCIPGTNRNQSFGARMKPERVVLGVSEGIVPSIKPPVRIFLGTQPAQYRAERIFVWSIEQVRDPSRVYEIYLMKDLSGFDRNLWLTGFTNYRFAVPYFAGGAPERRSGTMWTRSTSPTRENYSIPPWTTMDFWRLPRTPGQTRR